jgi:hypothetical protein
MCLTSFVFNLGNTCSSVVSCSCLALKKEPPYYLLKRREEKGKNDPGISKL